MNGSFHLDGPRYHFSTEIPEHYDNAALRVMLCNPHQLFVYWEIPPRLRIQGSKFLLRIVDYHRQTATGAPVLSEMEIRPDAHGHYLAMPFADLAFTIELGRVCADGTWQTVCTAGEHIPSMTSYRRSECPACRPTDSPARHSETPARHSAASAQDSDSSGTERQGYVPPFPRGPASHPTNLSSWSLPGPSAP